MGFTVTGPRTFLAGSHPFPTDPTATSPRPGLIRRTDAGQTWTTVSAAGQADFHSLQQAGQILYGLDSRTSQAWANSDAGATWERRAKVPADDLAAHAGTPQEVWATTGEGLLHSTAGGATLQPVPGAPPAGPRRTGPGRRHRRRRLRVQGRWPHLGDRGPARPHPHRALTPPHGLFQDHRSG
ncbi:hypothetical protein [Streptomyces sp. NPDC000410]|uniref:hypothetical protein n=1 Tax=Streptomyces sp. NPDC000410 TaxID=3154254 RepID=UPI00331E8E8F